MLRTSCLVEIYQFRSFTTACPFLGPLVPLFWISGDVSSGVKSQSGFCFIHFFAEANVMYIPRDPPLVLHLLTSWWPVCSWSCPHILLQRWGCQDSNLCSQNICEPDTLPPELNRDRPLKKSGALNPKSQGCRHVFGSCGSKLVTMMVNIYIYMWKTFLGLHFICPMHHQSPGHPHHHFVCLPLVKEVSRFRLL